MFNFTSSVFADSPNIEIISITDTYDYLSEPYYSQIGEHDIFRFDFKGKAIRKSYLASYKDDNFQEIGTEKIWDNSDKLNHYFYALVVTCNTSYVAKGWDKQGNQYYEIKFKVSGLTNPSCDSDTNNDFNNSDGNEICNMCDKFDALLQLHDELNSTLNNIKDNVSDSLSILDELKEINLIISNQINDFSNEFKTDMNFNIDPLPDISDLLNQNKPIQNNDVFKDDNIYFKDEGDVDDLPTKMPVVPEPEHWPGFFPDDSLKNDKELDLENELNLDNELKKDNEFDKDDYENTEIFNKTPEMDKEIFKKDNEFKLQTWEQDSFSQDEIFKKDFELEKTHIYSNTNNFN